MSYIKRFYSGYGDSAQLTHHKLFFKDKNKNYLINEITKKCGGYKPDPGTLDQVMVTAYTMHNPYGDCFDTYWSKPMPDVNDLAPLNKYVLDYMIPYTVEAHKLWDTYIEYENGPRQYNEDGMFPVNTKIRRGGTPPPLC